ncbi:MULTISPECIES: ABC transporter permease [unclassified Candidatus Sulfotelmatobacter]|uniref:ABC transporter permease n=1 Tax=unclassified Candidatus Sulfotelmatobacter TaxID=2635724 RepID=UPI00168677D8|nr:ABC transporter permease [Kocuria sp. cx-116]MBD2761187.1 ABC transporter permease [Kocuria sp. cx-116]
MSHDTTNHSTAASHAAADEEQTASVPAPWLTVMNREIGVKLGDKAFVLSTVLTVLGIIGFTVFTFFMGERTTSYTVAATDDQSLAVVETARDAAGSGTTIELESVTPEEARALLESEEIDAAVTRGDGEWVLTARTAMDGTLSGMLSDAARDVTAQQNAAEAGTTTEQLAVGSQVETRTLADEPDRGVAANVLGFVFAMLFYTAAIIFGMAIANSVLEEKQNRVVEILATAIPVRHILYGKVAGNCVLAYAQIILYGAVGLLGVNVLGRAESVGWILEASGWFIGFFVVGFAAQASIWAVLGSLASRTEDLQSNTGPILSVLIAALLVGLFAKGTWLSVASYVPLVSSVAMPVRMLTDTVHWWEPWLALGLCAAFGLLMFRVGERIYQRAVFQGGQALTWRKALKLER